MSRIKISARKTLKLFFVRLTKILTKNIQRISENSQFFLTKNNLVGLYIPFSNNKSNKKYPVKSNNKSNNKSNKKSLIKGFFVREILTLTKKGIGGVFVD